VLGKPVTRVDTAKDPRTIPALPPQR